MFNKKSKYDINYLELTPQKKYEHETNKDGYINVLVPKFQSKFYIKYIMPNMKSPYIRANLDEFGSAIWLMLDGICKVSEIAAKLTEQYGERIQPVNERLTAFLTQIYRAGFISFIELKKGKKS
jgi:hypothetical protein